MTVEVALAVMASARVEYLTVCDGDDESTGLVTRLRLAVLRDSSTYTDRIRLQDVLDVPLPSPGGRSGDVGEYGRVPGVPALAC
ncbi:CBS domain-containing protein [Streptomyces sp. NPDC001093]|uniref:CBS domain-containing protein n=1 Tax=Streptomyces sp. NPDC001093 TaxID=3154376 RepID=UPI00332CF651